MASDGRLRRFLHLERARPGGPTAEPAREVPGGTDERISGVERPPAAPGSAPRTRTGARLERFGPEPEPTLELVDADGRRPFVRCRRCGMDNNVFATSCQGCSASLDTPEQHEFDERFWTARQAEAEREARDAAAADPGDGLCRAAGPQPAGDEPHRRQWIEQLSRDWRDWRVEGQERVRPRRFGWPYPHLDDAD